MQLTLYPRLSLFYFCYFAAIGVFLPYWPVYLHNIKGFSAAQIGELMAAYMLTKVVAPFIWGWVTDLSSSRIRMIRLACLLTTVSFAFNYVSAGYWSMMLIITAFSFFWNAMLPQMEALTLGHLGDRANRYSQIRLWGSIGFIVIVLILPLMTDAGGSERILDGLLVIFILMTVSAFFVPGDREQETQEVQSGRLWDVLRKPSVWVLLVACMIQIASHGAYYTFFSIYLDSHGYSRVFTGWMWALGVVGEVLLFIVMYRLIQTFGAARLFILSLFLAAIRWVILGAAVDWLLMLIIAQVLHAATYGLFHASAIHLIHQFFPGRLQGGGQTLYAGLSSGLGGAIGGLLAGYGWDSLGNEMTFYISAAAAAIAGVVAWIFVRDTGLQIKVDSDP